jgi:hypothetical protein
MIMARKKKPSKRGTRFQLYVRAEDLHTWWWACSQARRNRLRISQFVLLALEEKHDRESKG